MIFKSLSLQYLRQCFYLRTGNFAKPFQIFTKEKKDFYEVCSVQSIFQDFFTFYGRSRSEVLAPALLIKSWPDPTGSGSATLERSHPQILKVSHWRGRCSWVSLASGQRLTDQWESTPPSWAPEHKLII